MNARPLTVAEWTRLAEESGFEVLDVYQTEMALLEPKRMIADEGVGGLAKIMFNLARKPQIRERVLGYAQCFPPSRRPYRRYRSGSTEEITTICAVRKRSLSFPDTVGGITEAPFYTRYRGVDPTQACVRPPAGEDNEPYSFLSRKL